MKKNIKDHSNTEFSQLCYYQMKWRNNKDFQTLAQNRRNIDSLGKLQDWTKHKWILLILSNLLIRSNTNSQTTILKFFWDQYESRISQIAEFSAVETKKSLFISSCIPYARHYNLLLIRNRSWILTIMRPKVNELQKMGKKYTNPGL